MSSAHGRARALSRERRIVDPELLVADARYGFVEEFGTGGTEGRRRPGCKAFGAGVGPSGFRGSGSRVDFEYGRGGEGEEMVGPLFCSPVRKYSQKFAYI